MVDQELLEAMRQVIREETEKVVEEKTSPIVKRLDAVETAVSGVKVLLETDIHRDINLLSEGHQTILERLPDTDEIEALEARLSAVEVVIKKHSKDIQNLKKVQ